MRIILLLIVLAISLAKTLLDIEIETTQELIKLYERKSELIKETNFTHNICEKEKDWKIDVNFFDSLIHKQEHYLRKRNSNFTELIGFEDPFEQSASSPEMISDNQKEYEKKRDKLESLFHERLLFNEVGRDITHHSIMSLKPLTRSSSGGYMVQGILLGIDNKDIHLYDVYKNFLVNMSMEEYGGIKLLKGSSHNEDMYVAALSSTNQLCEFDLSLRNNFKRGERGKGRDPKKHFEPVNQTKSEEIGREDLFNKNYKRILHAYTYYVETSKCIDLNEHLNTTNRNFIHLEFYMNKGVKYYIIGDNKGYVHIINKGLRGKISIFSGEEEIIQIVKHSLTLIIVHKNDIRFLRFFKKTMANPRCHSGMADLKSIVVDTNHNGFIYGNTNSGEILMFKTERLVQDTEKIKWDLQGKLKIHIPEGVSKNISLASLTNYLIVMKADGNIEVFDMTNLNEFLIKPIGYSIKLPFSNYKMTDNIYGLVPQLNSVKSFNGDFFLFNFSGEKGNKAVLYEWLTPAQPKSEGIDIFSFKFPMFAIAFMVVLVLQFMGRKEGEENDIISMLFRCWNLGGRSGKRRFRSQKEKEMFELEKIVKKFAERNTNAVNKLGGLRQ